MSSSCRNTALGRICENNDGEFYLTVGSGSPAALLSGLGTMLACWAAGLTQFRMMGGVSAGAVITALAHWLKPVQLAHVILPIKFDDRISFRADLLRLWRSISGDSEEVCKSGPDIEEWRITGLLSTRGIATCIENSLRLGCGDVRWPTTFWTMGTTKDGDRVIFKEDGVYLIEADGKVLQLSDKPPPLQAAVRISCTIPIVMAALRYKGRFLFDGALSRDGLCPVGVQVREFGINPRKIIACYLGDDSNEPFFGTFHSLCRGFWGVDTFRYWGPEAAGVIASRPLIEHLHALKFNLTQDDKWLAILLSFEACAARLALEGLLTGERREHVQKLLLELGEWRSMNHHNSRPNGLAEHAEKCMAAYGLF